MRMVLSAGVDRDDVERALIAAGMRMIAVIAKSASHPAQLVFLSEDRRSVAHWVVDDRGGSTFLVFAGPDATRICEGASRALPHVSIDGASTS
jgi:hypothetical protein